MKALTWHGKHDVRISHVPDPSIVNDRDAIIRVTTTCICGSDLHLYDGYIPTMQAGDVLGHEFMGIVEDVGPGVSNLKKGDRVVVPFTIACGNCWFCSKKLFSLCDNSNPNAHIPEALYGQSPSALFGYSHMLGGFAGGQAEAVRVPFADVGPMKVPEEMTDEQVIFLSDIFPTGYQAAENCGLEGGETVAVWGAGPVGLFAIKSALMLGAEHVIAIDQVPERLKLAAEAGATPVDFSKVGGLTDPNGVYETLMNLTGGRGPDACIDAVGLEAHGMSPDNLLDRAKAAAFLATDRPHVLRQAIHCCRKGGTVSIPGVYGGLLDKVPMGAAFAKGLTFKMGQTHCTRYLEPLLKRIQAGDLDPTFIISHRMKLDEAPTGYKTFYEKADDCTKVVLTP